MQPHEKRKPAAILADQRAFNEIHPTTEGSSPMKIHTRRDVFKFGAAFAATATPALAFQMPITETPEPDLPHWWRKLTGETAATDPEVFHPWRDTVLTRELAVKIEELRELLLLMGTPVDVDTITDFRLHWSEGGVPQNVIAVGRSGVHGEGLHVLRPEFGWVDQSAKIGGLA